MRARSFSHVGITVSDFNRAVRFYWEIFGCPLVGVADSPSDRVRAFFGVDAPSPTCKIGWIRVPGGGVLEIFAFEPKQNPVTIPWNRIGLTHFSLNVTHLDRWHAYLTSKGVECVTRPERSPRGHAFFFARDFDGNLIELMDLGYKYHVLKWLGALGGWLFRRGMYKEHYRDASR
jgi:glyoxylase I family protein